jgi:hypothetical protein
MRSRLSVNLAEDYGSIPILPETILGGTPARSVFPLTPIILAKRWKDRRLTPSPLILAPAGVSSVFVK